jgi:Protein of unknown function (DUF3306)
MEAVMLEHLSVCAVLALGPATLTSLDSISAKTDIGACLKPGVPNELRLAALRRAWSADPAIRDFVGLSENAWDFNDLAGIPGFGELGPRPAGKILAQAFGETSHAEQSENHTAAAARRRPTASTEDTTTPSSGSSDPA